MLARLGGDVETVLLEPKRPSKRIQALFDGFVRRLSPARAVGSEDIVEFGAIAGLLELLLQLGCQHASLTERRQHRNPVVDQVLMFLERAQDAMDAFLVQPAA